MIANRLLRYIRIRRALGPKGKGNSTHCRLLGSKASPACNVAVLGLPSTLGGAAVRKAGLAQYGMLEGDIVRLRLADLGSGFNQPHLNARQRLQIRVVRKIVPALTSPCSSPRFLFMHAPF